MEYPVMVNEFEQNYHLHTGKEPDDETGALLSAIVNVINQAYNEGVKDGKKNM